MYVLNFYLKKKKTLLRNATPTEITQITQREHFQASWGSN